MVIGRFMLVNVLFSVGFMLELISICLNMLFVLIISRMIFVGCSV